MKRVILTGATGFVGANLTRRLIEDGHEVHVLVRPSCHPWRLQPIQTELFWHEVNLSDQAALIAVVERIKPDWIFHLAVHGAYSSQTDLTQMVQTNFLGTINLVEACLKVGFEAFVNTGSSSEYGFKATAPAETEWLEPNSHYAVTKASATLFCRYTAQRQKVHLPTLRLYSVYGPYEEPSRLMPTLIAQGLQGKLPPLVNPDIARDYVYVDDVNEAYILAATRATPERGAVYNVGTGTQVRLREVVEVACRVLGITAAPEWGSMPNRQWDSSVWIANNHKIQTELGWVPRYSFEQGFKSMTDWFQQHRPISA
ncbi:MAG: NAD-dependent epimerase/dehydratase family protein [Cyanobacteria bacterium P01_G01_bin.38]